MNKYKIYYKRNLPHYQPPGYVFFITFRLNGSLPVETIKKLKAEKNRELKSISGYNNFKVRSEKYKLFQSQYFGKFDKILDGAGYGPTWLKNEEIAKIVNDALHYYDKKAYNLFCYTIMSNHVHIVFRPIVSRISDSSNIKISENRNRVSIYIVSKILQDLKKYTSRECNKFLNRSGQFWQHESYDHVVRDKKELLRIINYVLNNPVKAGLCKEWENWKWSYCNFENVGQ